MVYILSCEFNMDNVEKAYFRVKRVFMEPQTRGGQAIDSEWDGTTRALGFRVSDLYQNDENPSKSKIAVSWVSE